MVVLGNWFSETNELGALCVKQAQAAREEEALELKKQLAVLEEQASLSRKQVRRLTTHL